MSRIVFVNGQYCGENEASVSIFDRGYLFGDGVYEVVPVIDGQMVDGEYFLQRLDRSLGELQLQWPCSEQQYLDVMAGLIARNNLVEGAIYSQVTRGVADRDFKFPADIPTSMIAFTSTMNLLGNPAAETGIEVISFEDLRWKRRDIKSINLLAQVLAKQAAADAGAGEAWMVEDGFVTEGASSSAYIVKGDTIITRPLSNSILPGIRRRTVLELIAREGINLEQRLFSLDEAKQADEAFITSATTITLGVVAIDGHTIGNGTPGPMTQKVRALYIDNMRAQLGNH